MHMHMHMPLAPLLSLLTVVAPVRASSQEACDGAGPEVEMEMLLEKTIFNIDVLELSVRLSGSPAERLRGLAADGTLTNEERDSVAPIAADATCALATLDFVRNVSLRQLFGAIRSSTRDARDAGLIEPETYRLVDASLPEWYAFLDGRGVKDGDRMQYRIRGDSLNIRYVSAEGELLLDRTDVGVERRRSVLAGYFAPGSDFRNGLLQSLTRRGED